jgi:hypothetical protein
VNRPRHGYPLGALFLLVAACAVLTAIITPIGRAMANEKITVWELVGALLVGVIGGAKLGTIVGLFHYRILRGMGIGALTGAAIGLVAGPLMLLPAASIVEVFTASVGGSLLLLVVGVVLRLSSGKG